MSSETCFVCWGTVGTLSIPEVRHSQISFHSPLIEGQCCHNCKSGQKAVPDKRDAAPAQFPGSGSQLPELQISPSSQMFGRNPPSACVSVCECVSECVRECGHLWVYECMCVCASVRLCVLHVCGVGLQVSRCHAHMCEGGGQKKVFIEPEAHGSGKAG